MDNVIGTWEDHTAVADYNYDGEVERYRLVRNHDGLVVCEASALVGERAAREHFDEYVTDNCR